MLTSSAVKCRTALVIVFPCPPHFRPRKLPSNISQFSRRFVAERLAQQSNHRQAVIFLPHQQQMIDPMQRPTGTQHNRMALGASRLSLLQSPCWIQAELLVNVRSIPCEDCCDGCRRKVARAQSSGKNT